MGFRTAGLGVPSIAGVTEDLCKGLCEGLGVVQGERQLWVKETERRRQLKARAGDFFDAQMDFKAGFYPPSGLLHNTG